uniref:Cytochrome P450 family 27 subfamily B member 1 n=1 Tax=Pelodiscus sinensis TaxID=13735 RepID=K7GCC2_PELSI
MPQTLKLASRASLLSRAFPEILAELGFKAPVRVIKTHKTLEDMPGPSALSFFRDLFCKRGLARLHELQMEGKAKYGPVWKASFGPILTVHVAEPSLIEQVLRQEGKHPIRSDLSSWKDYRVCRGHAFGLLTAEGEEWQKIRSILGKHMLKPKEVESYTGTLRTCRGASGNERPAVSRGDLQRRLWEFWGLAEAPLGMRGLRFHGGTCRGASGNERHRKPLGSREEGKSWSRGKAAGGSGAQAVGLSWVLSLPAKGHIDKRMAEVAEKVSRGETVDGKYLTYYLAQEKLSMKSIYGNVTELLLAGVDTISSTLSWSLYELSRHPRVQAALHEEITGVMKGGAVPSAADVAQMPLLKAVVKEVLRGRGGTGGRDIQVGEYLIPRKIPASWHRYQPHSPPTPCTPTTPSACSTPLLSGPTAWAQLVLTYPPLPLQILMHFEVKPEPEGGPVRPMTRTLLVPETDINLQFLSR